MYHLMIRTYYLSDGVSMVTETSGTRTGTLDSEYENIGIIPIYFVLHWLLGLAVGCIIYEEGERRHAEGVCRTKIRGKKRKKKKKGKRRKKIIKILYK